MINFLLQPVVLLLFISFWTAAIVHLIVISGEKDND